MSKPAISTISSKGQTTIPVTIRRALDVGAGDAIRYYIEANGVRLVKADIRDLPWARCLQSTLTEWEHRADDDL